MSNKYILISGLAVILSLVNCGKKDTFKIDSDYNLNKSVTIPRGTIINFNRQGQTIQIKLPEEYAFVAETPDGNLSDLFIEGSLTCTCNSPTNGGCSPFVANGPKGEIMGCSMNNCNNCTGKISTVKGESYDVSKVNIIEKDNPIQFILTLAEYQQLREPNDKIFEANKNICKIQGFISGFQSEHLEELRATKDINHLKEIGYLLAPINFYGYRVYLPIDRSLKLNATNPLINELVALYEEEIGKYSCRCETNERGCNLKTKSILFVGSAVWCESGSCGSCALILN
jgi:hypothetical protein